MTTASEASGPGQSSRRRALGSQRVAEGEGGDGRVVDLSRDREEVRDEVYRRGKVPQQRH